MNETEFLSHIKANQGLIYKLVGIYAFNEEDKKDLYQEIMYQAWKGWPSYKGGSKISTWLYKVCLNTILTQKRRKTIVYYRDQLEQIPTSVAPISDQKEEAAKLHRAIRLLGETDRAIIAMHLDGYNNEEIGEMVGITPNNTNVKLHRIKQQLANLLKKL